MGAVYRSGQKLQTFHIKVNGRAPTNQWSRRREVSGFTQNPCQLGIYSGRCSRSGLAFQLTNRQYMTKQQLIKTLNQISQGKPIPGTIAGKSYKFKGIQKYSGRGRYSNLKGRDVIVLQSAERKRSIILFFTPLLLLVNSDSKDLTYGNLPIAYIQKFRSGDMNGIPNIYEYESHYKSLARYIQRLTMPVEQTA